MKPNVDLTENRIFTTPEPLTGLAKLIFDSLKITKPWDFEHNPTNMLSDADFRIPSIFWRKSSNKYETEEICDCCGQSSGRKPWAKNRCNCYSMTITPKVPWRF